MKLNEKNIKLIETVKSNTQSQINRLEQEAQGQINLIYVVACNEAKLDPQKHKMNEKYEIVKK